MDGRIERAVHTFVLAHLWLAHLARWLTHLGDPLVVTVVTVVLVVVLWVRGARRDAVFVAVTRVVAVVVGWALKDVVRRHRPVLRVGKQISGLRSHTPRVGSRSRPRP